MTPETGEGLAGSDSYVDALAADAYAAARNWADWAGADQTDRDAALVTATSFIDASYRFRGRILRTEQALAWPRIGAQDAEGRPLTGVPAKLVAATVELARLALTGPLMASPDAPKIKRERIKAGSVETETEYGDTSGNQSGLRPSVLADRLLAGIATNTVGDSGFVEFEPG